MTTTTRRQLVDKYHAHIGRANRAKTSALRSLWATRAKAIKAKLDVPCLTAV